MKSFSQFAEGQAFLRKSKMKKDDRAVVMSAILDVNTLKNKYKTTEKLVATRAKVKKLSKDHAEAIYGILDDMQSKIEKADKNVIQLRKKNPPLKVKK
jgi:hypothetical protein